MSMMALQITSLTIVYSTVYSGADQRKHQSSTSLAFVRRIHRRSVNSPHKWPVMQKMFPFDDVIMINWCLDHFLQNGCRWVPQNCIEEKSILLHVMAWCCQATRYYPSQWGPKSMSLYGMTRLRWVKQKYNKTSSACRVHCKMSEGFIN